MKRFARNLFLLSALTLTLASVGYSQTSETSSNNDVQLSQTERAELVTRCEAAKDEVVVSRKLIAAYKEEITAKEDALAKAIEKGELDESQIALMRSEIATLRQALADETAAYEKSTQAVAIYKKQLAKVTKKKNFFKATTKIFAVTTLAAAAAAGVLLLKP